MNQSKISVRYSKAIFELAKEQNILDTIYSDFKLIQKSIEDNTDFYQIFTNPVIKIKDKIHLLKIVFETNVSILTLKFLNLLVENNRESYISDIARDFAGLYRKDKNIKEIVLTTATNIDKTIFDNFTNNVSRELNCKVEIRDEVKPDMIGGVVVRIDNMQLDMSVATQLKEIKTKLKSEKYLKKL